MAIAKDRNDKKWAAQVAAGLIALDPTTTAEVIAEHRAKQAEAEAARVAAIRARNRTWGRRGVVRTGITEEQ